MPEYPHTRTQPGSDGQTALRTVAASRMPASARAGAAAPPTPSEAPERGNDAVTEWLLQREDLDTTEFSVLFAIHKLRARRRAAGWIGHADLRRCTGLAPDALGRVLSVLRERGLIWMAPHPVKTGYARYLLLVQ